MTRDFCDENADMGTGSVGKTMAYTSIKFLNSKDELVARGSHTKWAHHNGTHGESC